MGWEKILWWSAFPLFFFFFVVLFWFFGKGLQSCTRNRISCTYTYSAGCQAFNICVPCFYCRNLHSLLKCSALHSRVCRWHRQVISVTNSHVFGFTRGIAKFFAVAHSVASDTKGSKPPILEIATSFSYPCRSFRVCSHHLLFFMLNLCC